ncbi:MAG: NAD(+)/NADH kinase, partial [Synergistaceae bacterium]|nr:NAD(+)/NADH kinase [Synergistaceae bacterium]
MRIGLFFNSKLEASAAVASAIKSAEYRGRDVEFVEGDAGDDHGALDLAVSIGGDGTFLLTSKTIMGRGFPLYGINTGHLGFLASGDAQSAVRDMRKILECDCSTFPRIPLKGEIVRDGRCVQCVWALNEIMVVKSFVSRPIALSVHMGNGKLYSIQADGIIAATPTGSTAYALSAGG